MLTTLKLLHDDENKRDGTEKIEITHKDILCVKIAGLCHDLGHGPFSHLFDRKFIPRATEKDEWKHEDASCELLDHMIKTNPNVNEMFTKNGIGDTEIKMIKDMILGDPKEEVPETTYHGRKLKKQFLYEIVSSTSL